MTYDASNASPVPIGRVGTGLTTYQTSPYMMSEYRFGEADCQGAGAMARSMEDQLSEKLDEVNEERRLVKDQLDRERLKRVTDELIETITSPAFIERMVAARRAIEEGEGVEAGARLLSVDTLRRAGIDIPDDFRITSRVFEDRKSGTQIDIINDGSDIPGEALGWGMCSGSGYNGMCFCSGFTT
jgi:hypothetical protein